MTDIDDQRQQVIEDLFALICRFETPQILSEIANGDSYALAGDADSPERSVWAKSDAKGTWIEAQDG